MASPARCPERRLLVTLTCSERAGSSPPGRRGSWQQPRAPALVHQVSHPRRPLCLGDPVPGVSLPESHQHILEASATYRPSTSRRDFKFGAEFGGTSFSPCHCSALGHEGVSVVPSSLPTPSASPPEHGRPCLGGDFHLGNRRESDTSFKG